MRVAIGDVIAGRDLGDVDGPLAGKGSPQDRDPRVLQIDDIGGGDVTSGFPRPLDCSPEVAIDVFLDLGLLFAAQPARPVEAAALGLRPLVIEAIMVGQDREGILAGGVEPVATTVPRCAERQRFGMRASTDPAHRLTDHIRQAELPCPAGGSQAGSACPDDEEVDLTMCAHQVALPSMHQTFNQTG